MVKLLLETGHIEVSDWCFQAFSKHGDAHLTTLLREFGMKMVSRKKKELGLGEFMKRRQMGCSYNQFDWGYMLYLGKDHQSLMDGTGNGRPLDIGSYMGRYTARSIRGERRKRWASQ
jgi:hypothetical protein